MTAYFIKWTSILSVQVDEIDEQHRRFIELINDTGRAAASMDGISTLPLIDRLIEYSLEHFHTEEAMMRQHGYPSQARHEAEHDEIARRLQALREQPDAADAAVQLLAVLQRWLVQHILDADKKLGLYLNSRKPHAPERPPLPR